MNNNYHYYNSSLKEFARELRSKSASVAEKSIWRHVLSRSQLGVKFKRQRPIENYIVDFFSAEIKLIVEIDGNSHATKSQDDQIRQDRLLFLGFSVIRFSESSVLGELESVKEQLIHAVHCLRELK